MILTGPEIRREVDAGHIKIDPFDPTAVGPNSVDLRLGSELRYYLSDGPLNPEMTEEYATEEFPRSINARWLLRPGRLYLGRTLEFTATDKYVPMIEGRSSLARLGVKIHQTAGFGDIGFRGTWTLEIEVIYLTWLHVGMRVCQLYFVKPYGDIELYRGRYQDQVAPTPSRFGVKHDPR